MRRPLLSLVALALVASACGGSTPATRGGQVRSTMATTAHRTEATTGSTQAARATTARDLAPGPNLAPGSQPAVLPGPVLIADRSNNRLIIVNPQGNITWEFPRPGDLASGQSFLIPDDAFFTPDGKDIVTTEEDNFVISLIDVATHHIVWRYGTPGVHGSGPNQLWNPDDAMMLPNGDIITADIKNCRILVLRPPSHTPLHIYGTTTNDCYHSPPAHWGSPNGAFPLTDGQYLITEINGDWVDGLSLSSGNVSFSVNPPGVSYPSDTNEVSPGLFLTADYSQPGQVETFKQDGTLVWRYQPTGADALNQPSLALPLPNGDVLLNDDYNHRVIVVDPQTNKVVWQYGHTGVPGAGPGYLRKPDGVDLAPPHSFTMVRASTMGVP